MPVQWLRYQDEKMTQDEC
nr:DUF1187 family protein [Escherichia coli]